MRVTLTFEGPLDAVKTLARYHLWGPDPTTPMAADRVWRAVRVGDRLHGYEVRWRGEPDAPEVTLRVPGEDDPRVVAAARREAEHLLGLSADLTGFYRMAKADPLLRDLVPALYGLRPSLTAAPLEMLVGAVCAQQVNLRFAVATRSRLVHRYGTPVTVEGQTVHAFPAAAALARARPASLRRLQFSTRKAEYVIGLARAVSTGGVDLEALATCDNEEVVRRLTTLRGLGRWTAEWFLARGLGRGDVCPAGDLAVRQAFAHYANRGRELGEPAVRRRARRWGKYQSLAVHYLLAGMRLRRAGGGGT
jgi:DNA-3-methyladenine glycosylase II